jgi:hypothetical protein
VWWVLPFQSPEESLETYHLRKTQLSKYFIETMY